MVTVCKHDQQVISSLPVRGSTFSESFPSLMARFGKGGLPCHGKGLKFLLKILKREREPFVFKNTQFLSVRASYLGLFQPLLPGVWDQQIGLR